MGIQGLFTYIQEYVKISLEWHKLDSCKLVIDGNNMAYELFSNCETLNPVCGGDFDRYQLYIEETFKKLQRCNIKPYVVMDGGHPVMRNKFKTLCIRHDNQIKICVSALPNYRNEPRVFPLCGLNVFVRAVQRLGIPVIQCDFEADDDIVVIAKRLGAAVLSNDSDFYLFGIPFVLLNSINWKRIQRVKSNNGNVSYFIPCYKFNPQEFCGATGVSPEHLPLLAPLLGNDFLGPEFIRIVSSYVAQELPKSHKITHRHKYIFAVTRWLSKQEGTPTQILDKVLNKIPEDEMPISTRKLFQATLAMYYPRKSTVSAWVGPHKPNCPSKGKYNVKVDSLLASHIHKSSFLPKNLKNELICDCGDRAECNILQNVKFPDWFVKAFRLYYIWPVIPDMLNLDYFMMIPQVEMKYLSSIYIPMEFLINRVRGFLWRSFIQAESGSYSLPSHLIMEPTTPLSGEDIPKICASFDFEVDQNDNVDKDAFPSDESDAEVKIEEELEIEIDCRESPIDSGMKMDVDSFVPDSCFGNVNLLQDCNKSEKEISQSYTNMTENEYCGDHSFIDGGKQELNKELIEKLNVPDSSHDTSFRTLENSGDLSDCESFVSCRSDDEHKNEPILPEDAITKKTLTLEENNLPVSNSTTCSVNETIPGSFSEHTHVEDFEIYNSVVSVKNNNAEIIDDVLIPQFSNNDFLAESHLSCSALAENHSDDERIGICNVIPKSTEENPKDILNHVNNEQNVLSKKVKKKRKNKKKQCTNNQQSSKNEPTNFFKIRSNKQFNEAQETKSLPNFSLFIRKQDCLFKKSLPSLPINDFAYLPTLYQIENMTLFEKQQIYLHMCAIDFVINEDIPSDIKFILYCISFWKNNFKHANDEKYVLSAIMSIIMFTVIDCKTGRKGHGKGIPKDISQDNIVRSLKLGSLSDPMELSISELIDDLSDEECHWAKLSLLPYHVPRSFVDSHSFNRKISHNFSAYQVTIYYLQLLNSLLCFPFPHTEIYHIFGGTFCYNMFTKLFGSSLPLQIVLETVFHKNPRFSFLFLKLYKCLKEPLKLTHVFKHIRSTDHFQDKNMKTLGLKNPEDMGILLKSRKIHKKPQKVVQSLEIDRITKKNTSQNQRILLAENKFSPLFMNDT